MDTKNMYVTSVPSLVFYTRKFELFRVSLSTYNPQLEQSYKPNL
jgi:hypothetical protein